ncbi:MAG: substrate-binding domain-containing protein [Kiritimatiellae bacterium]|nr:substrate-binding domain-containing protein [Kiritimatiellia bacterium]
MQKRSTDSGTPKRRYTRHGGVAAQLRHLIADLRSRNETFLPAERQLAERFRTSRTTLRKAVDTLLAAGDLTRGVRGTAIVSTAAAPHPAASFAFVTYGGGAGIRNYHWRALWDATLPLAHRHGLQAELVLLDWYEAPGTWNIFLSRVPPVVVVTSLVIKAFGEFIRSLLNSRALVIGVDENFTSWTEHVIAVNNYAAGKQAARMLAQAGYERPVYLGQKLGIPYLPYAKREQGFRDGIREAGLAWTAGSLQRIAASTAGVFTEKALKRLPRLLAAGYDAFFVHSDEAVPAVYARIQKQRAIPADVGLVTFASTDAAVRHGPPVTCVGHNTPAKARTLVEAVRKILNGTSHGPGTILLPPDVHRGRTIRKPSKAVHPTKGRRS